MAMQLKFVSVLYIKTNILTVPNQLLKCYFGIVLLATIIIIAFTDYSHNSVESTPSHRPF